MYRWAIGSGCCSWPLLGAAAAVAQLRSWKVDCKHTTTYAADWPSNLTMLIYNINIIVYTILLHLILITWPTPQCQTGKCPQQLGGRQFQCAAATLQELQECHPIKSNCEDLMHTSLTHKDTESSQQQLCNTTISTTHFAHRLSTCRISTQNLNLPGAAWHWQSMLQPCCKFWYHIWCTGCQLHCATCGQTSCNQC